MPLVLLVLVALGASCRATAPAARLPASRAAAAGTEPSPGCRGLTASAASSGPRTLTSGGRTRRFRLILPDPLPEGPLPLVLNLHGLGETPALQQLLAGMDAPARARGVAVVYPEGVGLSWNAGTCCGRAGDEGVQDVRFLRELVSELGLELCLDRRRVYATGMSNGGMMSYRLACEAGDVFAAIAPVAAVEVVRSCAPRRPVPVLAFNGTSDPLVPWEGGHFGLSAPAESLARWSARDGCGPARPVYARGDVRCEAAQACRADVLSCRVEGGGHTWPGGMEAFFLGHTTSDLDATATILDFFLDHPRGD